MKKVEQEIDMRNIRLNGPWFKEGQWSFVLLPYISLVHFYDDNTLYIGWLFWSVEIDL